MVVRVLLWKSSYTRTNQKSPYIELRLRCVNKVVKLEFHDRKEHSDFHSLRMHLTSSELLVVNKEVKHIVNF